MQRYIKKLKFNKKMTRKNFFFIIRWKK